MRKAKPTAARKQKLFLVVRQAIDSYESRGLEFTQVHGSYDDKPREVPVRGFAKRSDAEAFAHELEAELRASFPFPPFVGMAARLPLPEWLPQLLAERGLPPIQLTKAGYHQDAEFRRWWTDNAADLSAQQKAALWEPFAEVRFHHIREIELEG